MFCTAVGEVKCMDRFQTIMQIDCFQSSIVVHYILINECVSSILIF